MSPKQLFSKSISIGAPLLVLSAGFLPVAAMVISDSFDLTIGDPYGLIAIGPGTQSGVIAYSTSPTACAYGVIAVSRTCSINWTCSQQDAYLLDSCHDVAHVGVAANTDPIDSGGSAGYTAAVSGGDAVGNGETTYSTSGALCTTPAEVAIAVSGDACGEYLAVSLSRNATAYDGVAVGRGYAQAVPQSSSQTTWGWASIGLTGSDGGWISASPGSHASAEGGPAPIAISGTNNAYASGGDAPVAASGTGSAETCGGTVPIEVSGGAFLGSGDTYPCGY
jgi:hypothetical protein